MKRIISWLLVTVTLLSCLSGVCWAQDNVTLRTTEAGIQFIKSREGFSAYRMWDFSQYSIGYGTACGAGDYPNGITVEQADILMRKKLAEMELKLNAFLEKNGLTLSDHQYDALMSFTYNVGTGWLSGCRLSRYLTSGAYTEIDFASAMGVWCHVGKKIYSGLVLRRIREIQLFLYGDYSGQESKKYCYLIFNADGGSVDTDIYFYPEGSAYGPLQSAIKADRKFLGWFFENGTQVTEASVATENHTVKAKWQTPSPAHQAFFDLDKNAWYYTYVDELYNDNVINGYTDRSFRPKGVVTVGEALKLLLLSSGAEPQSPTDIHWASGYGTLALNKGYLSPEETADLNVPITRAVIAKLAAGALGLMAEPADVIFADTNDPYVLALYREGIIQGEVAPDGLRYYYPESSITRAELCAIVYRIRNR